MNYPTEKIGGIDVTKVTLNKWLISIYKPIYGESVTLNDRLIKEALKKKATLIVRLRVDDGVCIQEVISPGKWKKQASKILKVYNFPNNPMIMWQRDVQGDEITVEEANNLL
jgi:hypothetical protein